MAHVLYCPSCGAETRQQVVQRTHYSCPVCSTNTDRRNLSNTGKGLRLAGVYSEALGPTITLLGSGTMVDNTQSTDFFDSGLFTVSPSSKIVVVAANTGAEQFPTLITLNDADELGQLVATTNIVGGTYLSMWSNNSFPLTTASGLQDNYARVVFDPGGTLPYSGVVIVLRIDDAPSSNIFDATGSSSSANELISALIPALGSLPQTLVGAMAINSDQSKTFSWTSQDMVAITKVGTTGAVANTTVSVARRGVVASSSAYTMSGRVVQAGTYDNQMAGVTFKRG